MRGIGVTGMVQAKHAVKEAMLTLCLGCEQQLATTVDAIVGLLKTVGDDCPLRHELTEEVFKVAGVVAPQFVVVIAEATALRIRGKQQSRGLDAAGREHEPFGPDSFALAGSVDDLYRFDAIFARALVELHTTPLRTAMTLAELSIFVRKDVPKWVGGLYRSMQSCMIKP